MKILPKKSIFPIDNTLLYLHNRVRELLLRTEQLEKIVLKSTISLGFESIFLKMTNLGVPDLGSGVLCLSIRFYNVKKKSKVLS